jgi:antitoxin ParD1/3/4
MADRSTAVADASMNVSLPEALKDYVQESVAQGAFGSASDCVRALVREDRKRQAEARLEALLLEGLDSGDPTPLDAAEWESIRQEVEERIGAKRRPA